MKVLPNTLVRFVFVFIVIFVFEYQNIFSMDRQDLLIPKAPSCSLIGQIDEAFLIKLFNRIEDQGRRASEFLKKINLSDDENINDFRKFAITRGRASFLGKDINFLTYRGTQSWGKFVVSIPQVLMRLCLCDLTKLRDYDDHSRQFFKSNTTTYEKLVIFIRTLYCITKCLGPTACGLITCSDPSVNLVDAFFLNCETATIASCTELDDDGTPFFTIESCGEKFRHNACDFIEKLLQQNEVILFYLKAVFEFTAKEKELALGRELTFVGETKTDKIFRELVWLRRVDERDDIGGWVVLEKASEFDVIPVDFVIPKDPSAWKDD